MKVKTYQAADSEQAMRMISAAHGPDAVILDCKSIPGGVELVVSWEEQDQNEENFEPIVHLRRDRPAPQSKAGGERTALAALLARQRKQSQASVSPPPTTAPNSDSPRQAIGAAPQVVWSQQEELLTLKQELAAMKSMLMSQLKDQTWQQVREEAPREQLACHQLLEAMDIDPALAAKLEERVPAGEEESVQREMLKMLLCRKVPIAAPPASGAICLVGPQGAGKTTSIAKLAAQHVMAHGREGIAILTTDTARVGAQEQLRAYGRILQIPVHSAQGYEEAARTFKLLQKKSLVLVDTAGLSFRDKEGLRELEALVSVMPGSRVFLTLPADSESYVQSEIIDAYSRLNLEGVVVSRIDEAMRLGAVLSNLVLHRLPAVWCSNGPKVPQNLSAADAGKLVNMAMRMAKSFAAFPPTSASAQSPVASSVSVMG